MEKAANIKIHFSIDDVIKCFKFLSKTGLNSKSIFDSTVFEYARQLHERFGINISFYCMLTDGTFTLEETPDLWKDQFSSNSDWMKFGFHCLKGNSDYSNYNVSDFLDEYEYFIREIKRITGTKNNLTDTIRLHYFSANEDIVNYLSNNGIKRLLCADDDRISYCLSVNDANILNKKRILHNAEFGIDFVKTDIRIENISDLESTLKQNREKKSISIFTHEKYLDKEEIRNTIMDLIEGLINE